MKALITTLFLFVSLIMVNAQEAEQNRFQQSENAATGNTNGSAIGGVGGEQTEDVGNPAEDGDPLPVPIDDNLPLLVVMGASIAVYHFRKKMMIKTK